MDAAPVPSSSHQNARRGASSWLVWLGILAAAGILLAIIFPGRSIHHGGHSVDGSNLRIIGNAIIVADSDRPGWLYASSPADIYAFAAQLARSGLNDPMLWLSKLDPKYPPNFKGLTTILNPDDKSAMNSNVRDLPFAITVALFPPGTRLSALPPTTPLAWTRGLQADGTWSEALSPYGNWGGYIFFVGGNQEKFKQIKGYLISTQGKPTSNIFETLPPGTRVLEFTPPR